MAWGLFSLSFALFLFPTDFRQLKSPLPTLSFFPIADAQAKIPAPESAGISWTLSLVSATEPQRTATESCDADWVTALWFVARYSTRRHMGKVRGLMSGVFILVQPLTLHMCVCTFQHAAMGIGNAFTFLLDVPAWLTMSDKIATMPFLGSFFCRHEVIRLMNNSNHCLGRFLWLASSALAGRTTGSVKPRPHARSINRIPRAINQHVHCYCRWCAGLWCVC